MGKENIDTATHCVTRLRLVLKDDNKVDKDALDDNTLVKGQFKADNQYQIVVGPGTVDEVYKQFIQETGVEESSKDDAKAAASKGNPLQRLIKLLGDIFIPILPALVTAGLLMGINNLLTMKIYLVLNHLWNSFHSWVIYQILLTCCKYSIYLLTSF